jgi:hypothetical protein
MVMVSGKPSPDGGLNLPGWLVNAYRGPSILTSLVISNKR